MERRYIITINADEAHQPGSDPIFDVVRSLVNKRVEEFPKEGSNTEVSISPFKGLGIANEPPSRANAS